MKMSAFSVFDNAAKVYGRPFFALNVAVAIRSFTTAVNDPATEFYANPQDFRLFEVGVFDVNTGQFETDVPHSICGGQDVKGNKVTDEGQNV